MLDLNEGGFRRSPLGLVFASALSGFPVIDATERHWWRLGRSSKVSGEDDDDSPGFSLSFSF